MGSPDSHLASVARPGFRIDGRADAALAGRLTELVIGESADGLYHCEAQFNNWGRQGDAAGFLYFDGQTLDFGKRLEVLLGNDVVFDGRITALQADFPDGGAPRLRILAEDRFQDLRMTRRTRSFFDIDDSGLLQRIAGDHGLTVQASLSGPTHKVLAQVNQSDLAFLRERARRIGAEIWMEGSTLHAARRADRGGTAVKMVHGARLREFSVIADLSGQCSKTIVGGWDRAGKSAISEKAGDDALRGELGNDRSGASILASAFSERVQTLAHLCPDTAEEAGALARAHFVAHARRFVVARATAEADARLRVGATVDLEGLGPLFNGKYALSATTLRFDGHAGLRTEFTAERAGIGRP